MLPRGIWHTMGLLILYRAARLESLYHCYLRRPYWEVLRPQFRLLLCTLSAQSTLLSTSDIDSGSHMYAQPVEQEGQEL